jgi:Lrp/AsnC family transcriptional regulator, leucine-responsive regulatory protein
VKSGDGVLDAFDHKILKALSRDGRMSWSDLARSIGLSCSGTLRRVRKLEESGVIEGYSAQVQENYLHPGMHVVMSVTLKRQVKDTLDEFEGVVSQLSEISSGHVISGSLDYLLHGTVRDLNHFQELVNCLTKSTGVSRIQSSFVMKTFVRRAE